MYAKLTTQLESEILKLKTLDECRTTWKLVTARFRDLSRMACAKSIAKLKVGKMVTVEHHGVSTKTKILKINFNTVTVMLEGRRWRVPASLVVPVTNSKSRVV